MNPSPPSDQAATQPKHSSDGLMRIARSLLEAVAEPRLTQHALRDLTQDLCDEMTRHFASEEEGGYFADAVRRAPRLSTQAQELCQQHEPLAESAEKLNALVRAGVESPVWWERVTHDATTLAEFLLNHEVAERELLQVAYSEDLGSKD